MQINYCRIHNTTTTHTRAPPELVCCRASLHCKPLDYIVFCMYTADDNEYTVVTILIIRRAHHPSTITLHVCMHHSIISILQTKNWNNIFPVSGSLGRGAAYITLVAIVYTNNVTVMNWTNLWIWWSGIEGTKNMEWFHSNEWVRMTMNDAGGDDALMSHSRGGTFS